MIYARQFTSSVYCGMLLSKSWAFDTDIYLYLSGDLMPVCCQPSQWQQISTYGRRRDFNYEKYQTGEDSYNINNYGYYSIWNYAIYGNNLPYKYITGISCAGCGMTRAWIALLHFDINTAFMYHPLFSFHQLHS